LLIYKELLKYYYNNPLIGYFKLNKTLSLLY